MDDTLYLTATGSTLAEIKSEGARRARAYYESSGLSPTLIRCEAREHLRAGNGDVLRYEADLTYVGRTSARAELAGKRYMEGVGRRVSGDDQGGEADA